MAEQKRVPRASEEREKTERPKEWQPPNQRIELQDTADYKFRWVRLEYNGVQDQKNMQKRLSEGYELVRPDDDSVSDLVSRGILSVKEGRIERGGLVLCKFPRELAAQRNAYYAKEAELHQQSVSRALDKERHESMPLTEKLERRTSNREG